MAATLAIVGCGGPVNGTPSAPAVQRVASATLEPGGSALSRPLPPNWVITMKVWFPAPQSTLRVGLGSAAVMVFDGSHIWHQVELTRQGLVVDGRRTGASPLDAARVSLRAQHGGVEIGGLLIRRTKR
jgi:hypothetical protein